MIFHMMKCMAYVTCANVLHNRSVEMAKKYGVKLSVRSKSE